MSLFSKLSGKGSQAASLEKQTYPWSQRKLSGASCLPRVAHATTQHNDRVLCLFGGVTKGTPKKDMFLIDPVNLSASAVSPSGDAPSARCYHSIVSVGNQLVVFGGQLKSPADHGDNTVYTLNLQSRQWTKSQSDSTDPIPRQAHAAAVSGNQMFIHGGHTVSGNMLGDLLIFHIGAGWDFGGSDGQQLLNDVWSFDLSSQLWTNISAQGYIPSPREGAAVAYADGAIYLFGGRGSDGQALGDLCAYRIYNQRWYMFQNMGPAPTPRYGHSLTAIKERIYVFGGLLPPKAEDPTLVHVLDTSRIKYPPDALVGSTSAATAAMNPDMPQMQVRRSYQELPEKSPPSPRSFANRNAGSPHNPSPPHGQPPSPQYPPSGLNGAPHPSMQRVSHFPDENEQLRRIPSSRTPLRDNSLTMRTETAVRPTRSASLRHPNNQTTLSHSASSGSIRSNLEQRHVRPVEISQTDYDMPEKIVEREEMALPPQSPPTPLPSGQTTPSPVSGHRRVPLSSKSSTQHLASNSFDNGRQENASPMHDASSATGQDERAELIREIKARDAVIADMKSKEQWWRTEVSLARKLRVASPTQDEKMNFSEADIANGLFDVGQLNGDQVNVFEELVKCKMEIKKFRAIIGQTGHQESKTVMEADKMRLAALQEAAYFKSKYMALQSGKTDDAGKKLEDDRMQQLEARLASALATIESKQRDLDRIHKQAGHDQAARRLAQERAQQAQQDALTAQQAQSRALEENTELHARASTAESQARDYTARMAELSNRLAEALAATKPSGSLSEAKLQVTKLEAANLKARGEIAMLQQQLASNMDEIASLTDLTTNQQTDLTEYERKLEDAEVKLSMMKHAMKNKGFEIHDNDFDEESTANHVAKLEAGIAAARRQCDMIAESERLANEKAQAAIAEAENYRRIVENMSDEGRHHNKDSTSQASETHLQTRIQQLERDLEENRNNHQTSSQQLEEWKVKAADAKDELELVMQTVHHLKKINADLDDDLNAVRGDQTNDSFAEERQTWLKEKALLESQLIDLKEKLAGLENTALDSMSRAEELSTDVKQLEDDREMLIADRQKYKTRYAEHKRVVHPGSHDEVDRLLKHWNTHAELMKHTGMNHLTKAHPTRLGRGLDTG
ncbi:Negative regulator of mitotic exit [Umbelopsis sp. WA50703]